MLTHDNEIIWESVKKIMTEKRQQCHTLKTRTEKIKTETEKLKEIITKYPNKLNELI